MVAKPTDAGSSVVRYGGVVLALGLLTSAAIAYHARTSAPPESRRVTGAPSWRVGGFDESLQPGSSTANRTARTTPPVGSGSDQSKGTR
jgi:hypothetical protein